MLCHRLCVPTANLFSPRRLFDVVDIEDATDADCTTVEASVCNQSSAAAQLPSSSEKLHSVCKHVLQGVFTEKDLDALSAKATQLIEKDSIRDGFDSQSHFVKSTSSNNPHTVNRLASGMFACGNECLGYKTRKLCSHVIAVAFREDHLTEFLSKFKEGIGKRPQNLTTLTTFGVNSNAGKKRPMASRAQRKSPDPVTSAMTTRQPLTIGDVLASNTAEEYTAETSSDPLRLTIR